MPLSDNPNARVLYWLSTDLRTPKERRPAFVCRSLTRAQSREKNEKLAEIRARKKFDEAYEGYLDIIVEYVQDWRYVNDADGKPLEFNRANVDKKLADVELKELAENFDQFDEVDAKSF